ncbi:flagellar filament capping protein FliD [Campylobacter sp. VicNov18]|uniref:flagellar filament capping protein FliD n=1 Tax=Campylobacter bilis TaxID=2691918 RepID=UPI00130DA793|nr:flagellar filament capping protein FliD [Campylobacter bilis]MPV64119.1 flagellar filament capping protein FliD [Campylobacter hepaticus]MBM0637622.1 flagellar filament capping protein FliD [Campylobacter bilis]MCC8278348.1 flagellar filament capping protein FliD [Campylobacter bilis]MCC8299851.1 flagellar filament capping protein FliD [Campylobacter bilis]MCC8301257.1 flagellar filament capping protein FliD [Campylobacter bilis]
MAFGSLSSLGFGSGVLTQDTLDKLKQAEQKARIDPYTKKIEENTTKQKDLTELKTKLSAFQSAVSSLADASAFAKRKVNSSVSTNPPASLSASSGVALQSMKINVTQLAQKDVYQSKGLVNDTGIINANLQSPTDLTFFSNGKEYTVTIDKNTTYRDLADKINEASGGEIIAKIVNTGEKDSPYRLTLSTKETGEDSAISFYPGKKDSEGKYQVDENAKTVFESLGWKLDDNALKAQDFDPSKNKKGVGIIDDEDNPLHIQKAQDAKFTMDGVKMTRSSNTITDLGVGLTLTLNSTGEIDFDVLQDTDSITKAMQDMVDAYNDLVLNLNAATDYNSETGTKGSLQGISEVNSIRSKLVSILFQTQSVDGVVEDANGNKVHTKVMLSLQDYGLSMTESGTLNFDSSAFENKVKENPSMAESFFSGITQYKDINYTGDLIKQDSLKEFLGKEEGKGITFEPGKFQIIVDFQTYDLSKNADGTDFKLTGETEEQMLQNLASHINSKGIKGLTVKVESYDKDGEKGYKLNFKTDGSSDFAIKGDEELLKRFGLSQTSITAQALEGVGVFSQLKAALQSITGKNGSLTKYDESLTNDTKSLTKIKESTQSLIDTRYETMASQWLQYEGILSRLNRQLTAVQSMIEAANNSNN